MKGGKAVVAAVMLTLAGCGAADRTTWRVDQVHVATPLVGAHAVLLCDDCHRGKPYDQATTGCADCHHANFDSTSVAHRGLGASVNCAACHSTVAWSPATFSHDSVGFLLTGRHTQVSCAACHLDGVWPGQPTDCRSCHWTRRQDDPWLLALGEACGDCHTTEGWAGAPFDHLGRTGFALVGRHADVACVDCHPGHDASTTPTGCGACHAAAGQAAGHPAFATDCETCHSATAWTPSTYNHELAFPVAQGRHSGFTCLRCHDGATFQDFTCIATCHARASTDGRHGEVQRYAYVSSACFECHPRGQGEGGKR
jgi:hypothetical protein